MDEAATSCSYQQAGSVSRKCVLTIIVLHRAGDRALRRRSIKLLFAGSAFRVSVSGLVLGLNGGRRAQPGHVVKDRGSPPWLHPRRCAAWGLPAVSAGHDGLDCGNHPMDVIFRERPRRSRPLRVSSGPQGVGLYGVALSNTLDNRMRAACDWSGSLPGLAITRWARRAARSPTKTPPSRGQLRQ